MTTRTRPNLPRSFSSGYDADGEYIPIHDLRHTQSLPASFPSTQPWRQRNQAITGPRLGQEQSPTLITHIPLRRERVITPAEDADSSGDIHKALRGGIPMRRSGWGAGMLIAPQPAQATVAAIDQRLTSELESSDRASLRSIVSSSSSGSHDVTRASTNNPRDGGRQSLPHSSRSPGQSTPMPWSTLSLSVSPPTETELDAERVSITPPGAPLLPSTSRFGVHRHYPGLDHHEGGPADEDTLPRRPLLTPTRGRSHTVFRPIRYQRLPVMSRFATYGPDTEH